MYNVRSKTTAEIVGIVVLKSQPYEDMHSKAPSSTCWASLRLLKMSS